MENAGDAKFDGSFWENMPAFDDPLAEMNSTHLAGTDGAGVSPLSPASENVRQHMRVSEFLKQSVPPTPQVPVGPSVMSSPEEPEINNESSSNFSPASQFQEYDFAEYPWSGLVAPPITVPSETTEAETNPIQTGAGRMKKIEFHEGKIYKLFGETYIDKEIIPNEKTNNLEESSVPLRSSSSTKFRPN